MTLSYTSYVSSAATPGIGPVDYTVYIVDCDTPDSIQLVNDHHVPVTSNQPNSKMSYSLVSIETAAWGGASVGNFKQSGYNITTHPTWNDNGTSGFWDGGLIETFGIIANGSASHDRFNNRICYPIPAGITIPSWAFTSTPTHLGGGSNKIYRVREPVAGEILTTAYIKHCASRLVGGAGALTSRLNYSGSNPLDLVDTSTGIHYHHDSGASGSANLPIYGKEALSDYTGTYYEYATGVAGATVAVEFNWVDSKGNILSTDTSSFVAYTSSPHNGLNAAVPYDFSAVTRPANGRYWTITITRTGTIYSVDVSGHNGLGAATQPQVLPYATTSGRPDAVSVPGLLVEL